MIAPLVYSLVSCGAVRQSVVASPVGLKLERALTSACGPEVHRSSHLHTGHTHKYGHIPRHTYLLILRGSITICQPYKGRRFLA